MKAPRRDLWVAVLTLATAPALVALGKANTNTFEPSRIRRYGGDVPYVKVIEQYPPGDHPLRRGRAFPAGHASGGFALLSLAGFASTRRGRIMGIFVGLTSGTAMGTYQMFKGAHYLSHTLFTAIFCWIVFLAWRRILGTKEHSLVEEAACRPRRFVPGVCSLISIPAGMARVRLLPFLLFSTMGLGMWTAAPAIVGSKPGHHYGSVQKYLGPVAALVVNTLLVDLIIRTFRNRKRT